MKKFVETIGLIVLVLFVVIFTVKSNSFKNKQAKSAELISNINLIKSHSIIKSKSHLKQKLDEFFINDFRAGNFAGTVLISYKGQVIYTNALGYANRSKKTPITTQTIFQIGSMSKQFTAIAILQLASKGILHLDDDVTKFYPDFPYKGINIRMLLTHRSGLPNYVYQFEESKSIAKDKLLNNQEMVQWLIKNNQRAEFKPNSRYQYSNTGYALLAAIIEKATGMPYATYIKENIFKPLGMNHSFFYTDLYNENLDKKYHVATGYLSPNQEAGKYYLNGILGDKGMFTTLEDLHKWDTSLYKEYILPKNWIDSAFSVHTKTRLSNIFYGYGWKMYFLNNSFPVHFHSGWWQGYQSVIIRLPKDTVTIIVLKNKKTKHPINQRGIIDILYPNNQFWSKTTKSLKENNVPEEIE